MMKALLAALVLMSSVAFAQNPGLSSEDYSVVVHVQSSRLIYICATQCSLNQGLKVVIDGKKYELSEVPSNKELLRVGDYKARISKDVTTRPYEYERVYEFLFADGKTRKYFVSGETE